jgi:hypothetical protein
MANCADRSELDQMMAQDPFVIHELVTVDVQGFMPALHNGAFPQRWAQGAKSIVAD